MIPIAVGQKLRQATNAVAAHFGLRAIGVEDPHAQLSPFPGGQGQDYPIAAHTKAAVTEPLNPARGELKAERSAGCIAAIKHQEIVSQALVFAELQHDGRQ